MAHHQAPQDNCSNTCEADGCADAFATVAIMTIVIATVVFWLHGMA